MNAKEMPWGDDLAGSIEQALAVALAASSRQLVETVHIPFPWSRYQAAQANNELELAGHLGHQLEAMLQKASEAQPRHVITVYAGADLDWACERIGRCAPVTAVFSCLLTHDFNPPPGQRWHPIAMPCADGAALTSTAPMPYRHLQRIWQAVHAGQPPTVLQGSLLLPGNPILWQQLFAAVGADRARPQHEAARVAALIAEEHGEQNCVIQILRMLGSSGQEAFSLDANNLKLADRSCPDSICGSRPDQIAYSLCLKHSHRTPLAYRQIAERCLGLRRLDLVDSIAITGNPGDFSRGANSLCISEEPWWDLRSCAGRYGVGETGYLDGFFEDLPIPYYLAVNPLILDRLRMRLDQLAAMSTAEILQRLIQAPIRYLGIHEFRLSQEKTGALHPSLLPQEQLRALSHLRTKIGIHARARGLGPSFGKGWGRRGFQGLRRKAYVDWHLDKLRLIRSTAPRLGMAIENVHVQSYVTEKPFDMLCCGVVPITYAAPGHVLHRYLEPAAHLNVYGCKLLDILDAIESFRPDERVALAIQLSADRLAHLFSSRVNCELTLSRVAERCEQWVLEHELSRSFRGGSS